MDYFLLIDKPEGKGSFDCVRILRRMSGVKRIGFAGTLDPLASGLMIFAVGEATKLIPYLEKSDKRYDVTVRLGAESDTYDAQGKISEVKCDVPPGREEIVRLIEENFTGEREQTPPAFSAVHVDGKRAYDLARMGKKVNLKPRKVVFYEVAIVAYEWPALKMSVHCGSGTYVRSLAHDLGRLLGCGGYVEALRRTAIGRHAVKDAVALDKITAENLADHALTPQDFFDDWPSMDLDDGSYAVLANGGMMDGKKNVSGKPVMAVYKGKCAGVIEEHAGKLKFARKFNIF
jgi:tRNA pseudouridine55 synthase